MPPTDRRPPATRAARLHPGLIAAPIYAVGATGMNLVWSGLDHLTIGADDHALFLVVARMYEAVWTMDLRNFFNISFQSYGFFYFFLQMVVAAPAMAVGQTEAAVLILRSLQVLFGAVTLYLLVDIVRRRVPDSPAPWVAAGLILCMPGYWTGGLWNHPDHQMLTFVVLSLWVLERGDGVPDTRRLVLCLGLFGLALASKVQAVFFAPGVAVWLLAAVLAQARRDGGGAGQVLRIYAGLAWRSVVLVIIFFVLFNPYLLHPEGLAAFIDDVRGNAYSNLTNHGTFVIPSAAEKWQAVALGYFSPWAMLLLTAAAVAGAAVGRVGHAEFTPGRGRLALSFIAAAVPTLLYFAWFVNKTWTHYYLGSFALLAAAAALMIPAGRHVAGLAIAGAMAIVAGSAALNLPAAIGSHAYVRLDWAALDARARPLEEALAPLLTPGSRLLVSPATPLRPAAIGLDRRRLTVITGALPDRRLTGVSHIVLRTDDFYFAQRPDQLVAAGGLADSAWDAAARRVAAMRAGTDPEFQVCAENEVAFIFCRRP